MKPPADSTIARRIEPAGWLILLRMLLGMVIGGLLFVLLWAGLNFGFGTSLDGPIGALVMEQPCQRLARTSERLTGYTPGKASRNGRSSPSVCHFSSRSVTVVGQTDDIGFASREGLLILGGLVGYGVCFVLAILGAVFLVRSGRRLIRGASASFSNRK